MFYSIVYRFTKVDNLGCGRVAIKKISPRRSVENKRIFWPGAKKKEKIQTSANHATLSIRWNAGYGAGAAVIFLEKKLA